MLIEYGRAYLRRREPPQVMMIKSGKFQKANKKSPYQKARIRVIARKGIRRLYPQSQQPKHAANYAHTKYNACHHCKEVGHWKRNCPVYLAELQKKRKQVGSASSSGIFTIELFSFPNNNSWVYDTGCGTNICITKQGIQGLKGTETRALYCTGQWSSCTSRSKWKF
ncbi:retrotransposon protein, putative, ty1-copia subclass [Tanacetum coccineum]